MITQIDCDQLEKIMANGKKLMIVDIRDGDSYKKRHIPHAMHLHSMPELQEFCVQAEKDQPLLVYCYHGNSSQSVAQYLASQGFQQIYSLRGGFHAWESYHASKDEHNQ